jgi:hypothetical protein
VLSEARQRATWGDLPYPIRLIQFNQFQTGIKARLVELSKNLPSYVTLSHRWHGNQQWKTLRTSFARCLVDLPVVEFPQTFQDAIAFAMRIGIHYLWIDSICIIQDLIEDWEQQSAQIGRIFERSVCTLAAIDAFVESGKDRGLFLSREVCPTKISIESSLVSKSKGNLSDASSTLKTRRHGYVDVDGDLQPLSDSSWRDSLFTLSSEYTSFEMSVERSPW